MPTNPCPPAKKDRPRQPWRTKAIRNMQNKGWLISKKQNLSALSFEQRKAKKNRCREISFNPCTSTALTQLSTRWPEVKMPRPKQLRSPHWKGLPPEQHRLDAARQPFRESVAPKRKPLEGTQRRRPPDRPVPAPPQPARCLSTPGQQQAPMHRWFRPPVV